MPLGKQAAFKTNPVSLEELLRQCGNGKIQLPDFQRSWVWDEERIKGLIASISQAFPVGALMTLEVKPGAADTFARRPIQGADAAVFDSAPDQLLLDGQQRMTSLYQTCLRREVVHTVTPRLKLVKRWFYIDMRKSMDPSEDRENAIVSVPEDRRIKSDFDRKVELDLSTAELEYENLMFPLNQVFDSMNWMMGFWTYWTQKGELEKTEFFKAFNESVLQNFKSYQLPVIALSPDTSHEAVCLVFEKVNTGGKPLDAFELVTAMYAARGHRLRDDWLGADGKPGLQTRLQLYGRAAEQKFGVLEKVAATDVLQAIALLHGVEKRAAEIAAGRKESELSAVRATRQSLLDLPLEAYLKHRGAVEEGFKTAARFLRQNHIYRVLDLPYQGQLVPFAAILAMIGPKFDHAAVRDQLARWFWCGIFGELYGSAIESRFAKDVLEVPAWLDGGPEPSTITDGRFRPERLRTLRTRLSAAYKGIHALLMAEGARDLRSGQHFKDTVFFDEYVDIHHIFPQDWCKKQKIEPKVFDTVINKTPLSYKTNRILGGVAPSVYLERLETGGKDTPPISRDALDEYLASHAMDPALLRADDFAGFMADRESRLLAMISRATGHAITRADATPEEGEDLPQDDEGFDLPDPDAEEAA
ncbi:GmrSD restriction endonuclease domain-containing protein [Ostreiculturibacter nitratireducens]|uniref:GmrSD restriction endonuclease domain-containing protein n=1 Tax=Ostreiculturibacter nitratireducens TaxID=3075226 RepID=UPI0031B5878A